MSPTPPRNTPEGRIYNDLRNLAKHHHRDVAEYLTLYALEGLLDRLSIFDKERHLVLKGGVLLAAFAARRPTRDIDLVGSGLPNDITECERLIGAIAATPIEDGLTFDLDLVHGESIRDEADDPGVRVHLVARLASAKISFHVDISIGDPIWPSPLPTALPRLLGGHLRLLAYPDHMVVAEKIVTAIERGEANTRWRDFVDILTISQHRTITETNLSQALWVVATHRQIALTPLSQSLAELPPSTQTKWLTWRRKQQLGAVTPELFQDLLDQCISFTDPVLTGAATGRTWSPRDHMWQDSPATPPIADRAATSSG